PIRIWHDADGWHVRVRHPSLHDRVFAGAVRTAGTLIDVQRVHLEANDRLKLSTDGHTILFRFNNYGHTDGFDFNTQCAPSLKFGFLSNGVVVPPRYISIGATNHHPAHDPFVIKP
ncbi:MAG TPA: hypothetical protein VFR41_00770, partial [Acidimicrobiia bacterium]|nr:hypothetical protein [Acidimicrobiia bacterium]